MGVFDHNFGLPLNYIRKKKKKEPLNHPFKQLISDVYFTMIAFREVHLKLLPGRMEKRNDKDILNLSSGQESRSGGPRCVCYTFVQPNSPLARWEPHSENLENPTKAKDRLKAPELLGL